MDRRPVETCSNDGGKKDLGCQHLGRLPTPMQPCSSPSIGLHRQSLSRLHPLLVSKTIRSALGYPPNNADVFSYPRKNRLRERVYQNRLARRSKAAAEAQAIELKESEEA